MANYRIWVLDVVEDDGQFTVNDRSELRKSFYIKGDATDTDIIKALVEAKILKPAANTTNISLSGDDTVIYVDESGTEYPLLEMEKISENPLTRKEQAQIFKDAKRSAKISKTYPENSYDRGEYVGKALGMNFVARVHGPMGKKTQLRSHGISQRIRKAMGFGLGLRGRGRSNPPHAEFRNVGDFKHYLEFELLPQLDDAGMKLTAKDVWDLLALLKMRRFDADIVGYLKGQIKQYHAEGETEDVMIARILSTGIKFLYDETDGGKRVGHKNPLTSGERKHILRVASEHDRDAREHKSSDLRKFDAGTASGLREAVAIAGKRKNPAGRKLYEVQSNIGKARYVVSFHDGMKAHKDGSAFYDVKIFSNKRDRDKFIMTLHYQGYSQRPFGNPHGGSLYFALKNAGIPLDSHESDLYALYTPKSEELFKEFGYPIKTFVSQIDGKRWLEAPFAHTPWWAKRVGKNR